MEAMAAESLVASAWELDGFLTKIRWPVRLPSGQSSDIDVIGVSTTGTVRLAECKVPWGPRVVRVVDETFADEFASWVARLDNIAHLWADPPPWLPRKQDVRQLDFWICANVWFRGEAARARACAKLTRLARSACPHGMQRRRVSAHIRSTRDVLIDVVGSVRRTVVDEARGRRFGQPLLDAVRELVRYTHPTPHGGGRVGNLIAEETRTALLHALALPLDRAPSP